MTRLVVIALTVAIAGCGATTDEVVVSAAASLSDAFAEIEAAFEDRNPGVDVVLNLGGSSALREQILAGASADVFASANPENMDQVVEAGEIAGEPRLMAVNHLEIAVPAGNPAGITGIADFAREDLFLGLCAEPVPCGALARQALANAGVAASIDTEEADVRALLVKIEAGELDGGIVYATDVEASDGVDGIDIAAEDDVTARYLIARLARSERPSLADDFMQFVLSEEGRAIFERHGFSR